MTEARDIYLRWLQDAHAMEEHALTMLKGQARRLENYPALQARIQQHITKTKGQAEVLEKILARNAGDASGLKDVLGSMAGAGQTLGGMGMSDEPVKTAVMSYAFEHMEIATYEVLICTAEMLGDLEAAEALTDSLEQEEDMADWLEDHLSEIVEIFLGRSEQGREAAS